MILCEVSLEKYVLKSGKEPCPSIVPCLSEREGGGGYCVFSSSMDIDVSCGAKAQTDEAHEVDVLHAVLRDFPISHTFKICV